MSAAVGSRQRFMHGRRCPVCGGADGDPRGKGRRCSGFVSLDCGYAHCSRVECGKEEAGGTWAHRLGGDCNCGARHGEAPLATPAIPRQAAPSRDARKIWKSLALRDPAGETYLSGRKLWDPSLVDADLLRFNVGKTGDPWLDVKAQTGYRVAFPVRRPDGSIANVSLRRVANGEPKTLVLPDSTTSGVAICRPEVVQLTLGDPEFDLDEIELCEGGPDFLAETLRVRALMEAGSIRWCWVLGIIGTSNAVSAVKAFAPIARGRVVRLAFDTDSAGERAAREAAETAYWCGATSVIRERSHAKDVAEAWR
jgi:hypothetical protein